MTRLLSLVGVDTIVGWHALRYSEGRGNACRGATP
jgi:hypothetical protein